MEIILFHGLPPKNRKGSLTQRDGYLVVIAKEVSGRLRPSFAFVKAVYNYYHSNLKNVRGRVLELLENNGLNSERPISGDYHVFRLIAY